MALDGDKRHMQNKELGQKTRIEHEGGQYVMYLRAPSDRRVKDEEENKILKGNKFAMLAARKEETAKDSPGGCECRKSARKRSTSWEGEEG